MGQAALPVGLALLGIGAGAASGATAPSPFQQRHTFTGEAAPNAWMGDVHHALQGYLADTQNPQAMPVVSAPDLPAYQPHFSASQASGPQRRQPSASASSAPRAITTLHDPADPNTVPSDVGTDGTVTGSRDVHAARLALLALGGGPQSMNT